MPLGLIPPLDPEVATAEEITERDRSNAKRVWEWFQAHPEHMDGLERAYFAYQTGWNNRLRVHGEHDFAGPMDERTSKCRACGRTREMVRWGDEDPRCASAATVEQVEGVILGEERKYIALLEWAKTEVPRLISKMGLSGKTLAILHHTHGFEIDIVGDYVELTDELVEAYHTEMEAERTISRGVEFHI